MLRLDANDPFKLIVQGDDLALDGLYSVTVTATADGGVSDSSQQFQLRIQPSVSGCEKDKVTIQETIPALNLYYLRAAPLIIQAEVTQSTSVEYSEPKACPV